MNPNTSNLGAMQMSPVRRQQQLVCGDFMQIPGGPGDERKTGCGGERGLSPGWLESSCKYARYSGAGDTFGNSQSRWALGSPVPGPSRCYKNKPGRGFPLPKSEVGGHV